MPVYDSTADPESNAISFVPFGSEEWLKNSCERVRGHAATGVGDGQDDSFFPGLPLCSFAAADQEPTAPGRHCVDGIANEVT